jgi:tetratricopeptide (TPR) repeat protein
MSHPRTTASRLTCGLLAALTLTGAWASDTSLVLDNALLDAGDSAAHLTAVLAAIEADPTGHQVSLLLTQAARCWNDVTGGRALAAAALERATAKAGDHFNRDDLLAALVGLKRAQGDLDGALALQRSRGFLSEWTVTGSFGLRPNAALHEVYEPERAASQRELDPTQTFRTRSGELASWRPLRLEHFDVAASLAEAMDQRGSVAYALTHVELTQAAEAYLVWTGPSAKIWINRSLASVIDRGRHRLDAELRIPVQLVEGWNRILVKVTGGSNARFTTRLTTREGATITPQAYAAAQPVDVGASPQAEPLASFTLTELAQATTAPQRALLAYALLNTNRGEEGYVLLEELLAAHPELAEQAWFHFLRGDVARRADHLPDSIRRDRARAAYAKALELDPQHAIAKRRLADFAFEDDQETQGILLLEEILADHPSDLRTRLALFDTVLNKGWLHEAGQILDALVEQSPELTLVLNAQARLLERRGRHADAQAAREKLLAADRSQVWVVLQRIDEALVRGDEAAALAGLEAMAEAKVWDAGELAFRRAQALLALGNRPGAEAALRASLAHKPWDRTRQTSLSNFLLASGGAEQAAEAKQLLEATLKRDPGRHDARRLRDAIDGDEDRFWEEWAPDVERLLAEAPSSERWPRAATVCLFDQTVTRIYPDGASSSAVHQLWRILDESGKERYGARPQAGRLLSIRTITPAGESLRPISAGGSFQMPGLTSGAVVEHAFLAERGPAPLQLSDGPFFFQDPDLSEPFWFSRWVIMVHRDAPVELIERNMDRPDITRTIEERGEWRVFVYTARDQPRTQQEPGAPDRLEFLPWVKVLQRRSMEELGELYREQGWQGTQLTPTVRSKTAEVLKGIEGDAAQARALYRFVKEHVRQGRGGATASEILATRGGSATVLYLTMLRAAGIPCELVAAAPNPDQGVVVDWQRPELGHFTTLLIRVDPRDGDQVYVYPEGPRLAPYGRLPAELWGATAYVCAPEGGLLEILPRGDPLSEATLNATTVTLSEGGAATFEVRRTMPSYGAYGYKEQFASAPARALGQFFAQQAVGVFPGAQLLAGDAPDADQVGTPLQLVFSAKAPQVLRQRGDGTLELAPGFSAVNLTPQLGAYRERVFDLLLRSGTELRDVVRIELGPYACPRLPETVILATGEALFSLRFRREGSETVVVERRLSLRPGRVMAEDYPAFRDFVRQVDEAEARTLILEPRTAD